MVQLSLVIFGYLLGAIPTGVVLARAFGRGDITRMGSGNIGATNVFRSVGVAAGIATFVGDFAKGMVAVIVARMATGGDPLWMSLPLLTAFVGHLYSPFLKFRGGKGVAVALGAVTGYSPLVGLIEFLIWIGVSVGTRRVSIGSLSAALMLPVVVGLLRNPAPFFYVSLVICLLIFIRHRDNIRRLIAGTEPGFRAR